jgi:hypothetical protein
MEIAKPRTTNRSFRKEDGRALWRAIRRASLANAFVVAAAIATSGCALNSDLPTDPTTSTETDAGADQAADATGVAASGIPRAAHLGDLTSAQAAVLCDWVNERQGGYGRTASCLIGVESTNTSQDQCINSLSSLGQSCGTLTVGSIEDCANATLTDLCKLQTASACASLASCG